MNKEQRKHTSEMLRDMAVAVENGRVAWYWIATKFEDGQTIKLATDGAPNRPGGM